MNPRGNADLERLKREYADRRIRLRHSDVYSSTNRAHLFMIQQRQRAMVDLLCRLGLRSLSQMKMLEIGCGQGDVLHDMMYHRMNSHQLYGVELLSGRLMNAQKRFPGTQLVSADGQQLPYADGQFDLVLQYTVFSSILDEQIKANLAQEMMRVVKKPEGVILWYDFWLNPTNPQTKGIRKAEIRRLFPGCSFHFSRITLAPPISRRLVPISWIVALLLEKLALLNTHYLVAIRVGHT